MAPDSSHPSSAAATNTGDVLSDADTSDADLVVEVARSNDAALKAIYERHGATVFSLALRLLKDRSAAEDVTQEVFVTLWRSPSKFDPQRGSLRSYLCAQAHNRSVDVIRAESARRTRQQREVDSELRGPDVSDVVANVLLANQVRTVVESLPPNERRAIELAYFDGLTYVEVAKYLEEPEGTIKSRIRSGLRTMHARLERAGLAKDGTLT